VTVQSDNAKWYQSHELVLIIGKMNPSLPIKITGIIHTERRMENGTCASRSLGYSELC
jgi:hypothetical protein